MLAVFIYAAQTWTLYRQIVNKLRTLRAMERATIEMKLICRAKREINVTDWEDKEGRRWKETRNMTTTNYSYKGTVQLE